MSKKPIKYVYAVKQGRKIGIYSNWNECKAQTESFSGSIFQKFKTTKEAEDYLLGSDKGDLENNKPSKKAKTSEYIEIDKEEYKKALQEIDPTSIYTDGGQNKVTGPKEAWGCVTNNQGQCILEMYYESLLKDMPILPKNLPNGPRLCIIAQFTDVKAQQNNGAELMALVAGLRIALARPEITKIYTDSQLLLMYWTKGYFKKENLDPRKQTFIEESIQLRKLFEARGGELLKISGKDNPSDHGFHR
jgi:ribonuclease HI